MSSPQKKPLSKNKTIELVQTVFGRLTDRKVCFLYANFGEDDRTLIMGTLPESDLVFGHPELCLMAIRIKNDDLLYAANEYFKEVGSPLLMDRRRPVIMNFRTLSTLLNKHDGASEYGMEWEPETKESYIWRKKKAKKGSDEEWEWVKDYIIQLVRSFFKFNQIQWHVDFLTQLLDKTREKTCYVPWSDEMTVSHKAFEITDGQLDKVTNCDHSFFGLTGILTLGKDILNISAVKKLKYNIDASHLCVVKDGENVERIAHRVDTELFTATLMRPYKVFFRG